VLETRLALEVSVARLAARRAAANPAELNRLRVAVEALERVADPAEVPAELDAAFHRGVAALTGNRYLMRALEPIWESLAGRALAATWSPEATGRTATEHRAIYEALVVGDGELAAFAMERHLRSLAATILDDSVFDGPSPRYYA
jgi:DNA-binding FadR family transcriptional regulator